MEFNTAVGVVIPVWCGLGLALIATKDYFRARFHTAAAQRCHEALQRLADS